MDSRKENLKSVFFFPWIGKNYETGINGKKILILGESHICGGCQAYCGNLEVEDYACRYLTDKTIGDFFSYKSGNREIYRKWMDTYTKFSNVFHNKHLTEDELKDFWNSIIFYNYVQYSTDKARKTPDYKEFVNSEKAFFEVVAEYKPDLIIAWGVRLWDLLPEGGEYKSLKEATLINNGKGLYYYTVDNKDIAIMHVYHPSTSAFSYSIYDTIVEALNLI